MFGPVALLAQPPGGPGTGDPPGGNGPPGPPDEGTPTGNMPCAGEPFSAGQISKSSGDAVNLGEKVRFSWDEPPGWSLGFAICCESDEEPICGGARLTYLEGLDHYEWCAVPAGRFTYVLDGTNENGCRVETTGTLTVRPPDTIEPNPYSPSGVGPLYEAFQDWEVTAAGEPLGPCYDACADEAVEFWDRVDKVWVNPPDVNTGEFPYGWRRAGELDTCPADNNTSFDYKPDRSLIFDAKRGALFGRDPKDYATGELIYRYRQKIGIALARCETCDPLPPDTFAQDDPCRWLSVGWYNFDFVKGIGDSVTHKGGTMSLD